LVTLKYCASGFISYPSLSTIFRNDEKNEYLKHVVDTVHKIDNMYPSFNFTLLYNAFTEKSDTEHFRLLKEYGLDVPIYTDSGGLQINLTKTAATTNIEEAKRLVYEEQAKLSDFGMCFDEMPVHINHAERSEDAHTRMDASGRYYILDHVQERGEQTGRNIKGQIEIFKKLNAKTKIFVILQGYTIDDYNLYAKGVYSQLTEEDYPYIEGVAIANTLTSDYFSAFDTFVRHQHHLEVPEVHKRHIHLLGVGGLNRIFPFIVLKNKSSFWPKDFIVNFDSTSGTSSFVFGRSSSIKNDRLKVIKLGYKRNKQTDIHCENLFEFHKDLMKKNLSTPCNSVDDFIQKFSIYNDLGRRKIADFKENEKQELIDCISHSFNSVSNEIGTFMHMMHLVETKKAYHLLTQEAYMKAARLLDKITTIEEYMEVRPVFQKILHSVRTAKLQRVQSLKHVEDKNYLMEISKLF